MTNCVFIELKLISFEERRARTVRFHRETTVLLGRNSTGKSSVLRSLFWTLGADPAKSPEEWDRAHVAAALTLELDGRRYTIVRHHDDFVVLDALGQPLHVARTIVKGIGPFLAELFGFGLRATVVRSAEPRLAPPAFMLSPFFIEQQTSWAEAWKNFHGFSMYPKSAQLMAEYHSGLRPRQYYELRARREVLKAEIRQLEAQQKVLTATRDRLSEQLPYTGFAFDAPEFAKEVDDILRQANELASEERAYAETIQDLRSSLEEVRAQERLVAEQSAELSLDYRWTTDRKRERRILCPTCGVQHENSFLERFKIARDVDRCAELARTLQEDREALEKKIAVADAAFRAKTEARMSLEFALAERRGALTWKEIIESEGRRHAHAIYASESDRIKRDLIDWTLQLKSLDRDLNGLSDKKRKALIMNDFRMWLQVFISKLRVANFPHSAYDDIQGGFELGGSEGPRALLAYYYAFAHVIARHGSSVMFPIVVDSPNQQDQDKGNLPAMISFIFEARPPGAQVILACGDLLGAEPDGDVIEFDQYLQVLRESEYESVAQELRPILKQSFTLAAQ